MRRSRLPRRRRRSWGRSDASQRGRLLLKLADAIEAHADELIELEARDTGHPVRDARRLDVPRTSACFRYFGGMADKFEGFLPPVYPGFLNYVQREPVGVVGQIVPWNFPLMFTSWKMAPALAAGNTIVLKPAELTPLSTLRIAELMQEVGFPDGVVNIVPGYGHTAGARLAEHPDVKKIAFTGSTATGRRIVQASAGNLKKVQLELGGKGPNIVFADASIPAAVGGSAWAIFHNQGQACIAGSRIILHEKIADEFLERFIALARSIRLGNQLDEATEMGPLTSKQHQERVLHFSKVAKRRRRRDPDRRQGAGARRSGQRLLRRADRGAGEDLRHGEPGRGVRAVRHGDHLCRRRRGAGHRQRRQIRAGLGAVDHRTCRGRTKWRARSMPAWCGSTATRWCIPARRSAASASPATGARWGSRRCANTPRRSRCGSMSTRRCRRITSGRGGVEMVLAQTFSPSHRHGNH